MIFKDGELKPNSDSARAEAAPASPPERAKVFDTAKDDKTAVGKAKGIRSRFESGGYVIEPVKRPGNRRRRALVAVLLLLFFLTGSVFYYGGNIAGAGSLNAVSSGYGHYKKTSAAPATPGAVANESKIPVYIKASSVEKDMRVRILGEDGYPVLGYRFEIEVLFPDGGNVIHTNDARDGRFYIDELESGDYVVSLLDAKGYLTPEPVEVEVLDKVQFTEIEDIEDKIVSQSEVNLAADDPQYGNSDNPDAGTPSVPEPAKDTVEFVESRVVESEGNIRYSGRVDAEGRLYARDGTLTNVVPVVVDGFLTGEYTLYKEPEPPEPENPEPEPEPEPGDGNGTGGDIDIFGKDQSGNFIYDITRHFDIIRTYYGWQDLDGKRYYFDKNGKKVTGNHIIQGKSYTFNAEGVLLTTNNRLLGVDVSTWQDTIDWNKVKAAGVEFVMIRAGFRGYGSGLLVEDNKFLTNLRGAKAAGLRVGVYFFSQAITEVEGVEEASMVISLIRKYGYSLEYPITIDSELSGAAGNTGRADNLSRAQRTAVCVAFCETVRNAGYSPMIYASKSWFENNLSVGSFSNYKIWLAHYTTNGAPSSYTGRYEMWQYTSRGSVNGIAGNVDMNYGYLGY